MKNQFQIKKPNKHGWIQNQICDHTLQMYDVSKVASNFHSMIDGDRFHF